MGYQKFFRPARFMDTVRCTSGITVDAGGITLTAGGVDVAVQSVTSTTPSLVNYGLSIMTNTTAVITATLAAPTVGVEKFIEIVGGSSSIAHVLKASSAGAVTFGGTDFIMTVSTAGNGSIGLHLIGATTARWAIMGSYGTLTGSTS